MRNLTHLLALSLTLCSCGAKEDASGVDTTLNDGGENVTVINEAANLNIVDTAMDDPSNIASGVPELSASWLVGTWAGADKNSRNPQPAFCETDNTIIYHLDGTFEYGDGGASGRYKVEGNVVTYFAMQTAPEIGDDPEEAFIPRQLDDSRHILTPVDENTLEDSGERSRRCRGA